jgi:hypothetical protein
MHHFRRDSAAAQRFADRRQRENEAPRLVSKVPDLTSLSLSVEERTEASSVSQPKHLRRIVVPHAPALFLLPCGDPNCKDGGHDVTASVMHFLLRGDENFQGEDACTGSLGPSPCVRVLYYQAVAEYRQRRAPS